MLGTRLGQRNPSQQLYLSHYFSRPKIFRRLLMQTAGFIFTKTE